MSGEKNPITINRSSRWTCDLARERGGGGRELKTSESRCEYLGMRMDQRMTKEIERSESPGFRRHLSEQGLEHVGRKRVGG